MKYFSLLMVLLSLFFIIKCSAHPIGVWEKYNGRSYKTFLEIGSDKSCFFGSRGPVDGISVECVIQKIGKNRYKAIILDKDIAEKKFINMVFSGRDHIVTISTDGKSIQLQRSQ